MSGGSKKTTTTNQQQTAKVELPAWMSAAGERNFANAEAAAAANPIQRYTGQITAGVNANESAASNLARASVGAGKQDLANARDMTVAAVSAPAPTVGTNQTGVATMRGAQADTTGMNATMRAVERAGPAPMLTAMQQQAAGAGAAPQAVAAREGPATVYSAAGRGSTGYDAATQGATAGTIRANQIQVGQFDDAAASRYMSPYTSQVQSRVLDEMRRQNEIERAGLGDVAQASRAFGGDRHAILEAEMRRSQEDQRLDYLARSQADAFTSAQGQFERDRLAGLTADQSNQGANLEADTRTVGFLDQMIARNMDATNRAREFGAGAANDAARDNQVFENQAREFGARETNAGGARNADRQQQAGLANQDLEGTFRLSDQAAENDARTRNADRSLEADTTNQGMLERMIRANQDAGNLAAEQNAGRSQDAARFNADALNRTSEANAGRRQDASMANMDARNTATQADANRSLDASKTNAGLYQTMLDRLLAGGAQMGEIGSSEGAFNARDLAMLLETGGIERGIEDDRLRAEYDEFLRMQDAPMDRYRDLAGILSGTPRNTTTSGTMSGKTTEKTKGSFIDTMLGAAQIAASFASDRRLKKDIALLGRTAKGLGVYLYRYLQEGPELPRLVGVMADEVAAIVPEALGPMVGGFRTVNYAKLGGAF